MKYGKYGYGTTVVEEEKNIDLRKRLSKNSWKILHRGQQSCTKMEPQIHIKTEIKEEPIDDFDFNPATLIPKVEVCEEEDVNTEPITEPTSATSLSCPKCDITYYSAMSIKNHIQVCKKSKQEINPSAQLPKIKIKGTYIH